MAVVNMLHAKTNLSKLVEAVESGAEQEVIIARNGKPAARLVPLDPAPKKKIKFGVAKGRYEIPDNIDLDNEEIAQQFNDGPIFPPR